MATKVISRRDPERNQMEYVEINIGKGPILTMVDSCATHSFMSQGTTKKIGLKFKPVQAQFKAMISPPNSVIGVAKNVNVSISEWTGKVDFIVVRIDDYEVVLGMEFMKKFEAMTDPHINKLYIYDGHEEVPIGIPTIGATTTEFKLTTMNVEEVKQDEEAYKRLSCMEAKLME